MTYRVAVVVSHPVQHFTPMYRYLAESVEVKLHVFFASGPQTNDAAFGRTVDLGTADDIDRFPHSVLGEGDAEEADRALSRHAVWGSLSRFAPDVVVIYGFSRRISRLGWSWALRYRCPRVYISDSEDRGEKGARWVRALRRPLEAMILATMTRVFAVGVANEEFYRRRLVPRRRIVRVPFSIDRRLYEEVSATAEARDSTRAVLEIASRTVVMTCGKFTQPKRQADIIRAVALTGRDDVVLLLVGSGPEEHELQSLAESLGVDVRFTGFVPPRDLPALYRAADIYVHSSSHDRHPLAVSEAIYSGLPAIVSDRTGSWGVDDDVRHGVNGFVHPAGDIEALARAIEQLVEDDALRQRFSEASRRIAVQQQRLANEGFVEQVLRFLDSRTA